MKIEIDGDIIEIDESADPGEFPPWYSQLVKLPESKREDIYKKSMLQLKNHKPGIYKFITECKCKLVGFMPSVGYTLKKKSDGELDVTFIHAFELPTLLFWHPEGEFGFFVNVNLKYNDTILNNVKGNNIDREIQGFTG